MEEVVGSIPTRSTTLHPNSVIWSTPPNRNVFRFGAGRSADTRFAAPDRGKVETGRRGEYVSRIGAIWTIGPSEQVRRLRIARCWSRTAAARIDTLFEKRAQLRVVGVDLRQPVEERFRLSVAPQAAFDEGKI